MKEKSPGRPPTRELIARTWCLAAAALVALLCAHSARSAIPSGGEPDTRRLFQMQLDRPSEHINLGVAYWIELFRDGKSYRCNNKSEFRSGDGIRLHIIPNTDGYAYIVLKSGSRGEKAVLFPSSQAGSDNFLTRGHDYALPTTAKLKFDNDPGTETLSVIFTRKPIDIKDYIMKGTEEIAFVSSGVAGSKDLVPTRMQLCWDDPAPVIMPEDVSTQASPASAVAAVVDTARPAKLDDAGMVTVVYNKPDGILSVDVSLQHQ